MKSIAKKMPVRLSSFQPQAVAMAAAASIMLAAAPAWTQTPLASDGGSVSGAAQKSQPASSASVPDGSPRSVIGVARLLSNEEHVRQGLELQRKHTNWNMAPDEIAKAADAANASLFGSSVAERRLARAWGIIDLPDLPSWPDVLVPDEEMGAYQQKGMIQRYKPVEAILRTDNFLPWSAGQSLLNGQAKSVSLRLPEGDYGVERLMRFFTYVSDGRGLLVPVASKSRPSLALQEHPQWLMDSSGKDVHQVNTPHVCIHSRWMPLPWDVAFIDSNGVVADVKRLPAGARIVAVRRDASVFESASRSDYTLAPLAKDGKAAEDAAKDGAPQVCSPWRSSTGSPIAWVVMLGEGWFKRAGLGPGARIHWL